MPLFPVYRLVSAMKAGIHPEYRDVVFQDVTSDFKILTRSTLASKETVKWEDGNEYPLIKVEVSSSSHPFYTGQNTLIDTSNGATAADKALRLLDVDAIGLDLMDRRYLLMVAEKFGGGPVGIETIAAFFRHFRSLSGK